MSTPRSSRKARSGGGWRKLVWPWLVVLVGCAAVIWLGFLYHRRPTSSSSIEDWVRQQDFDPVRPFRSDFLPGTLLAVGKTRDRVAMESAAFLEGRPDAVTRASLPNVTLTLRLKAKANAGASTAEIVGDADLNASVELSDLELLTLPLAKIKDLVRANSRVSEALASHPDDLFVILEALKVGKMRLVFRDASEVSAKAKNLTDWVKATFGSSANLDQSGTVQSEAPLVLGTRLGRLGEASKALGGNLREAIVNRISTADLEKFRTDVAPKVSRLYSNYDIFGLVISLGNYPSLSKRAGGELPDAVRTGDQVAADLRRLVPPSAANHIQVISSNEVSPKTFDPTQRISRSDLMQALVNFRDYVGKNSDPNKQTLVVFYYFGHGLGDGISKSVFLVPEQFVDDESKHISEVSDRLIDVADVNRMFTKVTDHPLFFIDACRAYKDQAKELIEEWKKTMKQGSDVSGILNAIQFATGIYGPTPMIFASDDGMAADTVKYSAAGFSSGTGPLALKFESILEDLDSHGGALPLGELIRAFESPEVFLPNLESQEAVKVRGYSFTRADFVAQFGSALIVSSDPVGMLTRKQAFLPPGYDLYSHAGGTGPPTIGANGMVRLVRADRPSAEVIQELVFAPGVGLVALDDTNHTWVRQAKGWRPIEKGLGAVRIGWDKGCGILFFQLDEKILYCFRDGQLRPAYQKFFSDFLGASAGDGFLMVQSSSRGTPSAVLFANGGQIHEIARIPESSIFDAAKDRHGRIWYSTAKGLWVYDRGKASLTGDKLWRPYNIQVSKEYVFVWSEDGRILYRIGEDESAEAIDLRSVGFGDLYVRRDDLDRGFAIEDEKTFFFGFGQDVVEISLAKARWKRVS